MSAILIIISSFVTSVFSYETCYHYGFGVGTCNGNQYCCGTYNNKCCDPLSLSVAAIIGIVIGGILVVSFVVTFICVCVKKNQRMQGTVIHPNQGPSIAMVQMYGQGQAGGAYMPPAPGQAQTFPPPPSYNQAQTTGSYQYPPPHPTGGFQPLKSDNPQPPPMYSQ